MPSTIPATVWPTLAPTALPTWLPRLVLLVMAAGCYWMARMNLSISPEQVVWPRVVLICGLSLIFAPFYLATDNPLWAYNLTLLASLSLSMFFTYLLVRRLTGNPYAGVLAGVAFACCPFVMFEIGRIQLVATQWIPA